jgi:DNA-binding transcriptional regulator YiaG
MVCRLSYRQIAVGLTAMNEREFSTERLVAALRSFVQESELSDNRISLMMGIAVESLRQWLAGSANPRQKSLYEIRAFLSKHGPKYLQD